MGEKYKIGIFVDTFFPMIDGVGVGIDNIGKILCKYVDLTVFAPAPRNGVYDDSGRPYKVVRCRSKKIPFVKHDYDMPVPKKDKEFLKKLEASQLDLVHIRSPFGVGKAGLRYAKKHKIPSVITFHSQYKQDINKAVHSKLLTAVLLKYIMRVFNGCGECWTVNDACKEVLYGYGINKEPVTMENGTDMTPVPDREKAAAAVNALCGIDNARKVLLFTGRLVALKNIFFIADVLKELKARGLQFTMIFIGDGADKNALQAKFEEEGLTDSVYFAGKIYDRERLAEFYARADLFVFPSFYDTDGVVKREAAAQGTPTIFSDGSIAAKSVAKGHNAYIARHDAAAYAGEIAAAFNNPDTYAMIAANARKELYIPWEVTAQKTFERYKFLIGQNRR